MDLMEGLFIKILNMGLTAAYIIPVILLIRLFIRKLPKRFSYYLWGAAGFRLLCPVSFSSIVSFFNIGLFRMDKTGGSIGAMDYIPTGVAAMPRPQVSVGIPMADRLINNNLPAIIPSMGINPMQAILFAGTVLWIAGMAALLVYSTVSYLRLKKLVSKAVILRDNLYECDAISSPFVLGILRPRIYIPFRLKEDELDYILRHERYHIRRLDHLIRPLSFLLLTVYWFNPLVWAAYFCMGKDMEMSCDEKVLSDMGASVKNAYSLSLLSFAANYRFKTVSPLAFGEAHARGRIKNVLNFKKPNWRVSAVIGILCIIVVISLAANPSGKADKNGVVPAADPGGPEEVSDLAHQLFEGRNPYIGDAPADGMLLKTLGSWENFGDYSLELETKKTPYVLRIVFTDKVIDRDQFDLRMFHNAAILLALIGNADEIQWSYPYTTDGQRTQIIVYYNRENLEQIGIKDIKSYGESEEAVQELMDFLEDFYGYSFEDGSYNSEATGADTAEADSGTDTASKGNSGAEVDSGADTGSGTEANAGTDSDAASGITPGAQDNTAAGNKILTMDDVLARKKWSGLTFDYFKTFDNAVMWEFDDEYALNSYIMFELTYDGKPFELQVSYMKADAVIDSILLLNKTNSDAILLYSTNPLYQVDTDVTSFLQRNIEMNMYLSYKLPEGFVNGPYTAVLMSGGNLILKEGEEPAGPDSAPVEWYAPGAVMKFPYDSTGENPAAVQYVIFENGRLTDINIHSNHSWFIGEPEVLENVREQAVLKEAGHDLYTAAGIEAAREAGNPIPEEEQTSKIWEIYFAREDGRTAYCILLNEKYFTKEDAIALAESVRFTEAAFQ
jgi:beta-lactamase regulating signal transducer with metallopeptidase domain